MAALQCYLEICNRQRPADGFSERIHDGITVILRAKGLYFRPSCSEYTTYISPRQSQQSFVVVIVGQLGLVLSCNHSQIKTMAKIWRTAGFLYFPTSVPGVGQFLDILGK